MRGALCRGSSCSGPTPCGVTGGSISTAPHLAPRSLSRTKASCFNTLSILCWDLVGTQVNHVQITALNQGRLKPTVSLLLICCVFRNLLLRRFKNTFSRDVFCGSKPSVGSTPTNLTAPTLQNMLLSRTRGLLRPAAKSMLYFFFFHAAYACFWLQNKSPVTCAGSNATRRIAGACAVCLEERPPTVEPRVPKPRAGNAAVPDRPLLFARV